jgi:hypothetical protein
MTFSSTRVRWRISGSYVCVVLWVYGFMGAWVGCVGLIDDCLGGFNKHLQPTPHTHTHTHKHTQTHTHIHTYIHTYKHTHTHTHTYRDEIKIVLMQSVHVPDLPQPVLKQAQVLPVSYIGVVSVVS